VLAMAANMAFTNRPFVIGVLVSLIFNCLLPGNMDRNIYQVVILSPNTEGEKSHEEHVIFNITLCIHAIKDAQCYYFFSCFLIDGVSGLLCIN